MPATSLDWVSPPRAAESLLSLIEPANDLVSYLIHMLVVQYIKRYMYICIYNLWYWLPWLVAVRIMRTQQDAEQINTRSQFTFILKPPVLTDDHSFSTNKTHTIIKFYNKKIEFNHLEKENRSNMLTVTKPIEEYVTKSLRDPRFFFF